jgi:hypothetical protein
MEDDGHVILCRELSDSLISVLLEDVEDDKSLEVHIAKRVRDAVSQAPSTTREKRIVSLNLDLNTVRREK